MWAYESNANVWRQVAVSFAGAAPPGAAGQNRAMVNDVRRGLVLLVLGSNEGTADVYGMRYDHAAASLSSQ
jgi:hypothetical protein